MLFIIHLKIGFLYLLIKSTNLFDQNNDIIQLSIIELLDLLKKHIIFMHLNLFFVLNIYSKSLTTYALKIYYLILIFHIACHYVLKVITAVT